MNLIARLFFITSFFIISSVVFANTDTQHEIVLPLEFSQQGFPIAFVDIQKHRIPLIFDTGGSKSYISLTSDIIKKLNLQLIPTSQKVCTRDDTGKKNCFKIYIIPEMKLGDSIMRNIPCNVMNKLWGGHYDEGFVWFEAARNGIIGLDLLRQFNVLLDYKNRRVILSKPGQYPKQYDIQHWISIPFDPKTFLSSVKINGADVMMAWDTGSNASIVKSSAKIPILSIDKKTCKSIHNKSCDYYFETRLFQANHQDLPQTTFFVQNDQFPFDGLIGSDFFKKHTVFFDFKNHSIFIRAR